MGCCASKPEHEDTSPLDQNDRRNASSQAINQEPSQALETVPSRSSHLAPTASRASRSRRRIPTSESAPVPLRPHIWTSKRQWTKSQLTKERQEFFDTRVTGHRDVWETLRSVAELLADGNVILAQSAVDAAEIVVPTGDLKNGAYDSRGNLYQMPEHIISDPVNVILDEPEKEGKESNSAEASDDEEAAERRREEKGKAVVAEEDMIRVKARLSDRGGPDVIIQMLSMQTVRWLIRRIQEEAEVSKETNIRIAYMGKILKENKSLQAQGWREGHVVNALVFQ